MQKETQEEPLGGVAIVERLQKAYGAHTLAALAEKMGESLSTVKGWKQRGSVPLHVCVKAASDTKCSLDWLVLGYGQMFFQPEHERPRKGHAPEKEEAGRLGNSVTEQHRRYVVPAPNATDNGLPAGLREARNAIAHGHKIDAELLREVLDAVQASMEHLGLVLEADKVSQLIVLIYEHEITRRAAIPEAESSVQSTAERYLKLVA